MMFYFILLFIDDFIFIFLVLKCYTVAPFQNCNQVNYLLGFFSFPFSSKSLESDYLT